MNTPDLFPAENLRKSAESVERKIMNGKPVFEVPAKTIINFHSGFGHKLMCDDLTFSTGTACAYSCDFCYVPDMNRKQKPYLEKLGIVGKHEDVIIRRRGAIERLRFELTNRDGTPKFKSRGDTRTIYSSPSVDVAANMDLVRETIDACKTILELTNWQIRLLSKSNLLPKIAQALISDHSCSFVVKDRLIFGVSTGTLDDKLAVAFERGTPFPSKRIASLHWLQDNGFRTFGMICPSLPQAGARPGGYQKFAEEMFQAIRAEKCEHVWAEVINLRGESKTRTVKALQSAGFNDEALLLDITMSDPLLWENYARDTFLAHAAQPYRQSGPDCDGQLRFLQYVNNHSREWWAARQKIGAILL